MNPAIVATDLHRDLAGTPAVRGLTLEAGFGRVLGLLGPNGAGKTTTLRMLAGLLELTSGTIEVAGHALASDLEAAKREIGFLTSGMRLYETFSPRESMRFFGRLRGLERAALERRIDELVAEFGMQAFADRRFGRLSAGERQRSTIANALVHDPRVLILDEITLSLDILASQAILEFVRRERDRGKCVIFSTHVMSEAEYLCDEIAFVHEGRIVDLGSAAALISRRQAANLTDAFLKAVAA